MNFAYFAFNLIPPSIEETLVLTRPIFFINRRRTVFLLPKIIITIAECRIYRCLGTRYIICGDHSAWKVQTHFLQLFLHFIHKLPRILVDLILIPKISPHVQCISYAIRHLTFNMQKRVLIVFFFSFCSNCCILNRKI